MGYALISRDAPQNTIQSVPEQVDGAVARSSARASPIGIGRARCRKTASIRLSKPCRNGQFSLARHSSTSCSFGVSSPHCSVWSRPRIQARWPRNGQPRSEVEAATQFRPRSGRMIGIAIIIAEDRQPPKRICYDLGEDRRTRQERGRAHEPTRFEAVRIRRRESRSFTANCVRLRVNSVSPQQRGLKRLLRGARSRGVRPRHPPRPRQRGILRGFTLAT